MFKKLFFLICIFCLLFSCSEENTYRIRVNLSNLQAQDLIVVYEAAESKTVDTISYDGRGAFVFMQEQDDYRTLTLYYDNY